MSELRGYAQAAAVLRDAFLEASKGAFGEKNRDLYWTYDLLLGTWLQVEYLQALLERAIGATSPTADAAARIALRDQAQFALWGLDTAIAQLEPSLAQVGQLPAMPNYAAIRSPLSQARITVAAVLSAQCERVPCATGP